MKVKRRTSYFCDICDREIDPDFRVYTIKWHSLMSGKSGHYDLCGKCLTRFKEMVKEDKGEEE